MSYSPTRYYYMKKYPASVALLKAAAYLTMLIDHLTANLYAPYLAGLGVNCREDPLYITGRAIGRIAFVLFAFMIAEGMTYTGNTVAYLAKLAVFSLISEFPFDLASSGMLYNPKSQNVFFTLLAGALSILIIQKAPSLVKNKAFANILTLLSVIGLSLLCYFIKSDYGTWGVLFIVLMYITKDRYPLMLISGTAALSIGYFIYRLAVNTAASTSVTASTFIDWFMLNHRPLLRNLFSETYGILALLLIYFYSGKTGRRLPKAFYYFFYPLHLLIIGIIRITFF